jgi:hypothetical protein
MSRSRKNPKVSLPAAVGRRQTSHHPHGEWTKDGLRLRHTEFVSELVVDSLGSIALNYALNPGLSSTFQWLSQIAPSFESYRFRHVKFRITSMYGTSSNGTIAAAIDYDPDDPAPASLAELMLYSGAQRMPVWSELEVHATSAQLNKLGPQKFVRTGAEAALHENKLYDSGRLFIIGRAPVDVSGGFTLEVEYDVELKTPASRLLAEDVVQEISWGGSGSTIRTIMDNATVDSGNISDFALAGKTSSDYTMNVFHRAIGTWIHQMMGPGLSGAPTISGKNAYVTTISSQMPYARYVVEYLRDTNPEGIEEGVPYTNNLVSGQGVPYISDVDTKGRLQVTGWGTLGTLASLVYTVFRGATAAKTELVVLYHNRADNFKFSVPRHSTEKWCLVDDGVTLFTGQSEASHVWLPPHQSSKALVV